MRTATPKTQSIPSIARINSTPDSAVTKTRIRGGFRGRAESIHARSQTASESSPNLCPYPSSTSTSSIYSIPPPQAEEREDRINFNLFLSSPIRHAFPCHDTSSYQFASRGPSDSRQIHGPSGQQCRLVHFLCSTIATTDIDLHSRLNRKASHIPHSRHVRGERKPT